MNELLDWDEVKKDSKLNVPFDLGPVKAMLQTHRRQRKEAMADMIDEIERLKKEVDELNVCISNWEGTVSGKGD